MAVETPVCDFGWPAPDFCLPATDGRDTRLADLRGARATLIVFLCNHCPYVKAVIARLVEDVRALQPLGIGVAAIMANDAQAYPEDSFENMQRFATAHRFTFPYLIDVSQQTARAYGAVCTPDFFGFDAGLGLQYRGRLDAGRLQPPAADAPRELRLAMTAIAETGHGPAEQISSMGCSIKWRQGR
jgi:peroxiredoxin